MIATAIVVQCLYTIVQNLDPYLGHILVEVHGELQSSKHLVDAEKLN